MKNRKKLFTLFIYILVIFIIAILNTTAGCQVEERAGVQNEIGLQYINQKDYEAALKAFDVTLAKYKDYRPECANAQTLKGVTHILMGQYNDALEAFNAVITNFNNQPDYCAWAYWELGIAYQFMGEEIEAKRSWMKLLETYPQSFFATFAKFMLGELNIDQLHDVTSQFGKSFENNIVYLIGYKYQIDKNFPEAENYYKRCIELSEETDIVRNLAIKALEDIRSKTK